jgi:hypothetical protein
MANVRRAIGVINRRGDEEWFAHGLADLLGCLV